LKSNDGSTTGLEHIAFTFDSLKDLCTAYKQRKEHGIIPGWCVVCCAFSVLANSMLWPYSGLRNALSFVISVGARSHAAEANAPLITRPEPRPHDIHVLP
jgi:hypothetical protein